MPTSTGVKRVDIKNVHSVNVCMAEDICIEGPVKLQPSDHSSSQNEASTTTVSSISPSTTATTAFHVLLRNSPLSASKSGVWSYRWATQTGCQGVKWKNTSVSQVFKILKIKQPIKI